MKLGPFVSQTQAALALNAISLNGRAQDLDIEHLPQSASRIVADGYLQILMLGHDKGFRKIEITDVPWPGMEVLEICPLMALQGGDQF